MTTIRQYRCNLCNDYIKPTYATAKEGFGVHYLADGSFVFRRVNECERHICNQCARAAHDELRNVVPADAAANK